MNALGTACAAKARGMVAESIRVPGLANQSIRVQNIVEIGMLPRGKGGDARVETRLLWPRLVVSETRTGFL